MKIYEIISVGKPRPEYIGSLEGYYDGRTSKGKYNDKDDDVIIYSTITEHIDGMTG